jgi:hypothetical protein
MLRNINGETGLPVHLHQLDSEHPNKYPFILPYKPDSYVILTFPVMEIEPLRLLKSQVQALSFYVSFNTHARFIFVVTGSFENKIFFLNSVIQELWYSFTISNLVLMIPGRDSQGCDINEDMYGLVDTRNVVIYSWYPYKGNYCPNNFDAVLMDQCWSETVDTFLHNLSLFPNKIPHKFAGCRSTAHVIVIIPYVIITDNCTDSYGRTVFRFTEIVVKFLSLVAEVLNLSVNYGIIGKTSEDKPYKYPINVYAGSMNRNAFNFRWLDGTILYIFDTFKWLVPCPKSSLRFDRILSLFSSSVWFTMLLVIFLTALVFWSSVKMLLVAVMKEPYGYISTLLFAKRVARFHGCFCSHNAKDIQTESFLHALCVVLISYEHNIPVVFHILSCESRI